MPIAANAVTCSQRSMRTGAAGSFGNVFQRNATSAANVGRLARRKSSDGSISRMKRQLSKLWPCIACSSLKRRLSKYTRAVTNWDGWPKCMGCTHLCGFAKEIHRPHTSGLWCRLRRLAYGKLDPKKYRKNRYMGGLVFPPSYFSYVLLIDTSPGRKFKKVKDRLLKHLLTICEGLAN